MIELHLNATKATIDQHGGWLTNLRDERGDILFPKRDFALEDGTLKQRGGCHVCLPNFGPGGLTSQLQHGFGREVEWHIEEVGDSHVLLTLPEGPGEYKSLSSRLTYTLNESSVELALEITNKSNEKLWIAPGFHPYFDVPANKESVLINGKSAILKELESVRFTESNVQSLTTMQHDITLKSDGLPIWAHWTDQLGRYVCVEPTQSGFGFLKEKPDASELLAPGEQKYYRLSVEWSPLEK